MCCAKSLQLCLSLCDPRGLYHASLLSKRFSRREYWSGLPFPSPNLPYCDFNDLVDPAIQSNPCSQCNHSLPHWFCFSPWPLPFLYVVCSLVYFQSLLFPTPVSQFQNVSFAKAGLCGFVSLRYS